MDPIKTGEKRNSDGTFAPGTTGGPGRPRGKTMKEYARDWFEKKSEEEKDKYIAQLEEKRPGFAWEMGEGKATQQADITSKGEQIAFSDGQLTEIARRINGDSEGA